MAAIRDGVALLTWESDTFAIAQGKDEKSGRYLGLEAGKHTDIQPEGGALLVKPEVAARQIRLEATLRDPTLQPGGGTKDSKIEGEDPSHPSTGRGNSEADSEFGPTKPVYRRFYGSVKLDSLRVGRDASRIAEEVIQHLTKLVGAEVEVTLEIQARLRDGASEKTVRDVTENCRTLCFDSFSFEEE